MTEPRQWWKFWQADAWRSWLATRKEWMAYKEERRRLDQRARAAKSAAETAEADAGQAGRAIDWLAGLGPQEVPVTTAKAETGLASVAGVTLLETRKKEGKEVWTPVDAGLVHFTDRQMVFSGRKDVKFRFDLGLAGKAWIQTDPNGMRTAQHWATNSCVVRSNSVRIG